MKQLSEAYRKIRNTARYILGNLYDFNPDTDRVPLDQLLPIDQWALKKLDELNQKVREGYDAFELDVYKRQGLLCPFQPGKKQTAVFPGPAVYKRQCIPWY